MPLTRVELIARGFAHADKAYPGGVPVSSLLSSPQMNPLTPEERISVIQRYDELTGGKPNTSSSALSNVGEGIVGGIMSAGPAAILGGALTVPSMEAIRAARAIGGAKPWLAIGKKFLAPIALTAGVGAVVGGTYGLMKHLKDTNTNKYLKKTLDEIRNEQDPENKSIKTMSLLATAPMVGREFDESQRYRDMGTAMGTSKLVDRGLYATLLPGHPDVPTFRETDTPHPLGGNAVAEAGNTDILYDDWRYVRGLGSLDPTVGPRGPLGAIHQRQSSYDSLSQEVKDAWKHLPKEIQEKLLRGKS